MHSYSKITEFSARLSFRDTIPHYLHDNLQCTVQNATPSSSPTRPPAPMASFAMLTLTHAPRDLVFTTGSLNNTLPPSPNSKTKTIIFGTTIPVPAQVETPP